MKNYNWCAIKSDNNSGVDENNVGNNYILLTEQIIYKKKKKSCENSMSLALLESRKRVDFWTKSTMHACRGIVFRGITATGKGKERKLVGKRKS